MTETNPWRDALIAALKARNRYHEHGTKDPVSLLDDLLREVASIAAYEANSKLGALAGLAQQLISTGLAINAAQEPQDRSAVAMKFQDAADPMKPCIADDTIPVIDAWARGCAVQSRYRGVGDEWRNVARHNEPCIPNFLHPFLEYRVAPGDHLVCFDDGGEFVYQPPPPLDWSEPG